MPPPHPKPHQFVAIRSQDCSKSTLLVLLYHVPYQHMPRQAIEIVVATQSSPLCVMTTHLEFHSEIQRKAQVQRLRDIHEDVFDNEENQPQSASSEPYQTLPRPTRTIICGDFNTAPDDEVYNLMTMSFPDRCPAFPITPPAFNCLAVRPYDIPPQIEDPAPERCPGA